MNGNKLHKPAYGPNHDSKFSSVSYVQPSTKLLLDKYKSSLEPMDTGASHNRQIFRQGKWNTDDPVTLHLLMETAMGDSQQFEIMSPEDIDHLKKDLLTVSSRLDATKRMLVLETKLRDAAQSINRLDSTKDRDGKSTGPTQKQRRLGSKGSGNDSVVVGGSDSSDSARKCEELAQELWQLERQQQDSQRRLLEHTAGILQKTHKGYLKKDPSPEDLRGVRESMNDILSEDGIKEFGDQSHYRPYSQNIDHRVSNKNSLTIPSSIDFAKQNQMIVEIEMRVEDLNARLRDMILELKPSKSDLPDPPRELDEHTRNPHEILWEQLEFLDRCLIVMHNLQGRTGDGAENVTEEKLEVLNMQIYEIMMESSHEATTNYILPPEASGHSLQDQLIYLEGGLGAIERRVKQLGSTAKTSNAKLASYQERAEQYVSVIGGLWDILTASDFQSNLLKEGSSLSDDLTDDEFSLQAFSTKVQELYARSLELQEHKNILTRQVQQQRELIDTSDSARDGRMENMRTQLEEHETKLEAVNIEAKEHREKLAITLAELEATKRVISLREQQQGMVETEALATERHARKEAQEAAEQNIQRLTAQYEEAKKSMASMETNTLASKSDLEKKSQAITENETSIKKLESQIVRLQTDLTFAKAELDGAYGTRAQRAAEMTVDPTVQKELEALRARNTSLAADIVALQAAGPARSGSDHSSDQRSQIKMLQHELGETIAGYEAMTKESIEHEREREQLENLVDSLRDRIESLESQLSDERVQMMGGRSPGGGTGRRDSVVTVSGNTSTSTMVLKNEFKKMMRETRMEHAKALRAEQEERRKLEGLVRSLKKDSSAGKTMLAPVAYTR